MFISINNSLLCNQLKLSYVQQNRKKNARIYKIINTRVIIVKSI